MSFKPIASYGFIGNSGTCALVGTDGSIDWCCLPFLDSPSIFGSLLDPDKGGKFALYAAEAGTTSIQKYEHDTNILHTTFKTLSGSVTVTDWLHMETPGEHERHTLPVLFRRVRCDEGSVEVHVAFQPQLDYARATMTGTKTDDGILLVEGNGEAVQLVTPWELSDTGSGWKGCKQMQTGEEAMFLCAYGHNVGWPNPEESFNTSRDYWQAWAAPVRSSASIKPEWKDAVTRSALAMSPLVGESGVAAAATTSLPEVIGSYHNWDYRFNWIRDSSFTVQALASLGHAKEARMFVDWICKILKTEGRRPAELTVLYPLRGMHTAQEFELTHLRGYMDSRPIRIGNAAHDQKQHDIYGEFVEAVYRSQELRPSLEGPLKDIVCEIVDYVCEIWRTPDHGIWELRAEPRHYLHSKLMCWVALDRGVKLAEERGWTHVDTEKWKAERDAAHAMILEKGFKESRKAFTQDFESDALDATALLLPIFEFLPADDPRMHSTVDAIIEFLADGELVYRSEAHKTFESAFGLCSFWLVDALVFTGRLDEARKNLSALVKRANHLGLYAEEIDPKTGTFLGNFPQAFTQLGLINSALYLSQAEGAKQTPVPLMGEEQIGG